MMIEVTGAAGDFNEVDAEVISKLRSRLVENEDEFWVRNKGDVGLYCATGAKQVVLTYSALHGYNVLYRSADEVDGVTLVRVEGSRAPVTIYFGGDPEIVPACAFASADAMWMVVERFALDCQRPQPPRGYEWSREVSVDANASLLTFEQGSPGAPDSPWGYVRVTLSTDGTAAFYRLHRTTRMRRVGKLDAARVQALVAALRTTNFPVQPQASIPPGASACILTLESPKQQVRLDYFAAIATDGYREVLQQFTELTLAFVKAQDERLNSWNFIASEG